MNKKKNKSKYFQLDDSDEETATPGVPKYAARSSRTTKKRKHISFSETVDYFLLYHSISQHVLLLTHPFSKLKIDFPLKCP